MKVLLDETVPFRLRPLIVGHDVYTVAYMGWKGLRNGRLLAQAAATGFDELVTTDGSIEHQQNLSTLPLAVVVLNAPSNDLSDLAPLVPALLNVLFALTPRSVRHVP
jgi:hypothetical protein